MLFFQLLQRIVTKVCLTRKETGTQSELVIRPELYSQQVAEPEADPTSSYSGAHVFLFEDVSTKYSECPRALSLYFSTSPSPLALQVNSFSPVALNTQYKQMTPTF